MQDEDKTALLVGHNELILNRLLSFMDVENLKNCRLVNSTWYENCQPYFKKKSVIELHFDLKENTPKKFVNLFQAAPLENTFSGARMIVEKENNVIDWMEHSHYSLIDFVSKYGLHITYFEMQMLDGGQIPHPSIALKKMLKDFMPNIEHLRVYIETSDNDSSPSNLQNVPVIPTIADSSPEATKLNKLKKLEWIVLGEPWLMNGFDQYSEFGHHYILQKVSTAPLIDIITCAPNLNSITTEGSVVTLNIFKNLSTEKVSELKEIFIDPRKSPHSLRPLLIQLTNLGNQNLRLESFDVTVWEDKGFKEHYCEKLYLSLIEFTTTQKNCLKKLRIRILPQNPAINYLEDFPAFPKMLKLEQLSLSYDNELGIEKLFGGLTFSELFPALKLLDIKYNAEILDDNQILPSLVSNNSISHNKVQVLKLFPMNWGENSILNQWFEMYNTAQQILPNIQTLEIYDEKMEIMHSYDGNVQNAKSFYLKTEPPVGWGQIVREISWPSGCFL